MRIVFMGTPDFAAAHLQALLDGGFDVCGVFTQPDKPSKRGMQLRFSPVKEIAIQYGLPVYQPETLRDGASCDILRSLQPDLGVVVAYGKKLPEEMLAIPRLGCINVHASLLPKFRGSAPIQWSVLNGEEETGVTTMHMGTEVDTGDIIYQETTKIGEHETSGELFERLQDLGKDLLCKTVIALDEGIAPRCVQDHEKATFTTMLCKEMSPIDFSKSPREVLKWIYGLEPWPCATMTLDGVTLRVHSAEYTVNVSDKAPGTVLSADKRGFEVVCGDGKTLLLTEVQASGGKRMKTRDFLLGHPFDVETQKWK